VARKLDEEEEEEETAEASADDGTARYALLEETMPSRQRKRVAPADAAAATASAPYPSVVSAPAAPAATIQSQRADACVAWACGRSAATSLSFLHTRTDAPAPAIVGSLVFADRSFELRLLDGHLCVNFAALLPVLIERRLFQEAPPHTVRISTHSQPTSNAPLSVHSALSWLLFYTHAPFPPGDYEPIGSWTTSSTWGISVSHDVHLRGNDGTPWITVHLLNLMAELFHLRCFDATVTQQVRKARDELRKAYGCALEWELDESTAHNCEKLWREQRSKRRRKQT